MTERGPVACLLRHARMVVFVLVALALASAVAGAQQVYPAKPIQMLIPYPAGGSDAVPRKLIVGMSERLGQPIVAVNKPGASTQIATALAVAAAPDGHTIYMSNPVELAAGPSLFTSLPFDALKDLTPISYVAEAPYTLLAAASVPVGSLAELVAYLKANPGKLRFGSYGVLTQPDILARRFMLATGTSAEIIPYQGGAPAFNAMLRDEVQLIFSTLIPTRGYISGGQMKPIAIAARERVAVVPNVPTLRELGLDIVDQAAFGLVGPKGLAPEIVARINETVVAELAKPDVRKFIEDMGVVPRGTAPAEFGAQLKDMTAQWAEFIPKLGIQKQ